MSKFKKLLSWVLVVAMTAGISIAGTMAYYTDKDSAVNVMVTGNVQITQNEQERDGDGGLQNFTQNQYIAPAADVTSEKEEITVNDYALKIRTGETYVDKIVSVTNDGKSEAYVRTIFAFPEAGEFNTTTDASEQWFHWNGISNTDTEPNNGWIWGNDKITEWPGNADGWDVIENVEINGKVYDIYVVTNKNIIAPGESTAPSLMGFYLDTRVDYDGTDYIFTDKDGEEWNLGDISNLDILVLSQAAQTDGFENAWAALDKAFGDVNKENAVKWFEGVIEENASSYPKAPADAISVNDMATLKAALADETVLNVKLANSIALSEELTVSGSKAIYGEGYSLSNEENYSGTLLSVPSEASLTLFNITVDGGNDWSWKEGKRASTSGWKDVNTDGCVDEHITSNGVKLTDSLIKSQGALVLDKNCVIKNAYYIGSWGTNYIVNVTGGSLELNGAVVEENLGTIFYAANADVVISDCYIADNMIYHANKGGVFNLSSTTCTMNGGKIVNNDGHVRSGFIFGVVNESKLTINDCIIDNNNAKNRGSSTSSVICCESGGDFDMNGGSITNNVGMLAGALSARWVLNDNASQSYINLNGGKIEGNACLADTWHNADVFIRDTVTTIGQNMTIVGNVVVDNGIATLTNDGTIDGDVYVQYESATMTNNGTIDGDVTVTAGTFNNNGIVNGTITKAE